MVKSVDFVESGIVSEFLNQGKDIPEGTITKYLTECFPDSCFARNYADYKSAFYEDINEELYNYFRYEVLNWCGCGSPEKADKQVVKYLNLIDIPWRDKYDTALENLKDFDRKYAEYKKLCKEYFGCESIYDNPLLLCLAYTMDAAGFSEHGSSIGGAWITDRGRIYRYAIMKHLVYEEESLDED